jgi:hypothetical protein
MIGSGLSIRNRSSQVIAVACAWLALALPVLAHAAEVNVPLQVDYLLLDAALAQKLYTAPGGKAQFFRGSDQCQYFYAEKPRFGPHGAQLEMNTDGDLSLGLALGGNCVSPIAWQGIIQAETQPRIEGRALKLRVADLNFYNRDRSKSDIAGRAFDMIKGNLIPQLEAFSYDLSPAIQQIDGLAASVPSGEQGDQVRAALQSLRLAPDVVTEPEGVRVTLQMQLPDALLAAPSPQPITPAEAAQWHDAANSVAGFIADAAKRIPGMVADQQLAAQLQAVADDARNRAQQAANQPPASRDPLPLFREDWGRLRTIVRNSAAKDPTNTTSQELLAFLMVGDAVFAIDSSVPALGSHLASTALSELSRRVASPEPHS